jgi:hypothetical protein
VIHRYLSRVIALILLPFLLAGCGSRVKESRLVDAIGAEQLIAYADELEKKGVWKTAGRKLPREKWLKEFAERDVIEVNPYMDGILIVFKSGGRVRRGVYVATDKAIVPSEGSGIGFDWISDGIYFFEEKVRARIFHRNSAARQAGS